MSSQEIRIDNISFAFFFSFVFLIWNVSRWMAVWMANDVVWMSVAHRMQAIRLEKENIYVFCFCSLYYWCHENYWYVSVFPTISSGLPMLRHPNAKTIRDRLAQHSTRNELVFPRLMSSAITTAPYLVPYN